MRMRSLASGVAAGLTAGVLLAPGMVPAGPSSDLVKQIENEIGMYLLRTNWPVLISRGTCRVRNS